MATDVLKVSQNGFKVEENGVERVAKRGRSAMVMTEVQLLELGSSTSRLFELNEA